MEFYFFGFHYDLPYDIVSKLLKYVLVSLHFLVKSPQVIILKEIVKLIIKIK